MDQIVWHALTNSRERLPTSNQNIFEVTNKLRLFSNYYKKF